MVIALLVVLLEVLVGHVKGDTHNAKACDIYHGRWVYDSSYPLYDSRQCSFIEIAFNCQNNGRPDDLYQKYRWKPFSCDLPRFRAKDFLERFRNKRIVFVGDSISLNQWQSLICMLHSHTPHAAYIIGRDQGVPTFTFLNHNVSVILSWNAMLVEIAETSYGRVLRLNSIADDDAKLWRESDVLVFNSWHWWLHRGRKKPWDFIMDDHHLRKDMDRLVAYEKALLTWAQWVEQNIDPAKTHVFFQAISPTHSNATSWGNYDGKNCSKETNPLSGAQLKLLRKPPAELLVERVIGKMSKSKRVHLLNITSLSQLRKDAHPSTYGGRRRGMDCSHWCLPGVPDTWNELLYAQLYRDIN